MYVLATIAEERATMSKHVEVHDEADTKASTVRNFHASV